MWRNSHPARDIANRHSQARTDLLTEARDLIIRAQHMGIEIPTSLLSTQHDIERALRNERRARRSTEREPEEPEEPRGAEFEETTAAAVDRGSLGEEDIRAAYEAEAEGAETGTIGSTTMDNPTGMFLDILRESSWETQDWNEALRLLEFDPATTPRWPPNDDNRVVLIIQPTVESIENIMRQLREGAPTPEESQDRQSTEVSPML